MNQPLRETIISYKGIPIGPGLGGWQFGQLTWSRDYKQISIQAQFVVLGTSGADLEAKVAALEGLTGANGQLTIQQGAKVRAALTGAGTAVVTFAGLSSADVGYWLVILLDTGESIARQIVSVAGSAVTVDSAVAAGAHVAVFAGKIFLGSNTDKEFTDSEGRLQRIQSEHNSTRAQAFSFSVQGSLPATEDTDCLGSNELSITYDASNRIRATLSGTYRPCDHDGDGDIDDAKAVYLAKIGDLETDFIAPLSGGGLADFEMFPEQLSHPMDSGPLPNEVRFSRTYQQVLVADTSAIKDSRLTVTTRSSGVHGLKNKVGEVNAVVSYSANIDHTLIPASSLRAYYKTTVRPLIKAAVRRLTGTSKVVIRTEAPGLDQNASTIQASWEVMLPGLGSTILSYSEVTSIHNSPNVQPKEIWDGRPHTYALYAVNGRRMRTVNVQVRSLKPIQFKPSGMVVDPDNMPTIGLGLPNLFNLFGGDGKSIGINVRWGGEGNAQPQGRWLLLNEDPTDSAEQHGEVLNGADSRVTVFSKGVVRTYLWFVDAVEVKLKLEQERGPVLTP